MLDLMSSFQVHFLLMIFAGWVNRRQQGVIEYLQEENRVVPSENTIRRGSSGSTLVPMVQSPDLGERDDLSGISVVDRPWIGRILLER
jgi:hypothetical protein